MNIEGYQVEKYLFNRTEDKALALANEFGSKVLPSLENVQSLSPTVVISTLPPAAQQEIFSVENADKFKWMFDKCHLALDLVYR